MTIRSSYKTHRICTNLLDAVDKGWDPDPEPEPAQHRHWYVVTTEMHMYNINTKESTRATHLYNW